MAKRKDYDVGYGKPPVSRRFQKGRSGNPSGRPKGSRSLDADLQEELKEEVQVTERGRTLTLTKQRLLVKSVLGKAIQGNIPAAAKIFELSRAAAEQLRETSEDVLQAEDEEIIAAYEARRDAERGDVS